VFAWFTTAILVNHKLYCRASLIVYKVEINTANARFMANFKDNCTFLRYGGFQAVWYFGGYEYEDVASDVILSGMELGRRDGVVEM
jgi:hypothetical protein